MHTLEDQRVVVTGGSRGLGLGIVEALVAREARVTVVARDATRLGEVAKTLGVATITGDASDPRVAAAVLREVEPSALVLSNGLAPEMAPIHEQTWDAFSAVWNADVKATFNWVQEALRQWLRQQVHAALVHEYEQGYRRKPETKREIDAAMATAISLLDGESDW